MFSLLIAYAAVKKGQAEGGIVYIQGQFYIVN